MQDSLGLWGQKNDAENFLNAVFRNKYCIRLEHQFPTGHGVLHLRAMYSDLIFERTPAPQVVKGSDTSKLVYKLINIQLEYETIHNDVLAKEATNVYCSAKAFPYDHIMQEEATFAKNTDSRLDIKVNPQCQSTTVTQGHTCFSTNPTQRAPEVRKNTFIPTSPKGASRRTALTKGFMITELWAMTCGRR